MGRLMMERLDGRVYKCCGCAAHLARLDELVSRSFHCRDGRAYLFNAVVNTLTGPKEERFMTTGLHTVVDVHCNVCMQLVGWKYEEAYEKTQKYKEGKFILERSKISNSAAPVHQQPERREASSDHEPEEC